MIHEGIKFRLETVRFEGPGGRPIEREVVRHPGSVILVPVLDSDSVVMIRIRRLSLDRVLLEFPAGTLTPGEDPHVCATRELSEETGYRAATLEPVGRFYPATGMSDDLMHVYVARGLSPGEADLEDDEFIEPEVVPVREIDAMIASGTLVDGKSITAWTLARGALG